jgi:hypothetical protein
MPFSTRVVLRISTNQPFIQNCTKLFCDNHATIRATPEWTALRKEVPGLAIMLLDAALEEGED